MEERTLNGQAVKALRGALGLGLERFAIMVGMSAGQLANIEAGRKTASPDAQRRIAAQLERAMPEPSARHHRPVDVWLAITYPKTALEATG